MILGAVLMGAIGVVDQVMAAGLRGGDLAALSYGGKVIALVAAVGAMAMGTAIMPLFSSQLARNDFDGVRRTLFESSRTSILATVPVMALVIVFSDLLVRLIFQHGAFGPGDTELVSSIQQLGALQIPFYALSILFARLLSSLRRNDVLCVAAGLSLALKVLLNLLLIPRLGVAGIALATSLIYAFSLSYLVIRSIMILSESSKLG
jgi:putative peptidoglycan lipid II flippase